MILVDDSEPVRLGLRYLTVAYRVRKVVDKHMITSGLSLARWKMVEMLDAKGSIRQKALAQELGFAERSMCQAVESLASDGLVERMPDPAGGRAKRVTLTDDGAAALAAGTKAGAQVLQGSSATFRSMTPVPRSTTSRRETADRTVRSPDDWLGRH